MYEIYEQLRTAGDTVGDLIAFVMVLYGLAECFFGFKLMKIRFAICGFVLGICLTYAFTAFGLHMYDTGVTGLMALAGGILGAVLLFKIYLIGVFLSNGGMTAGILILLLGTGETDIVIAVLCGILVGVLAVKFVRVWVIFCSALTGGMVAGGGIMQMLDVIQPGADQLCGLVLLALGFWFQWVTTAPAFKRSASQGAGTQTSGYQQVLYQTTYQEGGYQAAPWQDAGYQGAAPWGGQPGQETAAYQASPSTSQYGFQPVHGMGQPVQETAGMNNEKGMG